MYIIYTVVYIYMHIYILYIYIFIYDVNVYMYRTINIYTLEPVCPLFLGSNPSKEGLIQSKQGSFGFQV